MAYEDVGGEYNATLPTVPDGKSRTFQIDQRGRQIVSMVASSDTPLGYQQITSLSSAQALTVPTGARWAFIIPETQAVRWRDDGTNPTASVGWLMAAGSALSYTGDLSAIRFIEQTASAKLNVSYYA